MTPLYLRLIRGRQVRDFVATARRFGAGDTGVQGTTALKDSMGQWHTAAASLRQSTLQKKCCTKKSQGWN